MTSTVSNAACRLPSTSSNTSAAATTSLVIYHKIDNYYGVLVNGMTMLSGSYDACAAYVELFSHD